MNDEVKNIVYRKEGAQRKGQRESILASGNRI